MTTDATPPAGAESQPQSQQQQTPPSQSSDTPPQNPQPNADDADLITGEKPKADDKPADGEKPPEQKAPQTAAEKRAALEANLTDAEKEALKGKTDAEIEKLFDDKVKEEQAKSELGDFDITKVVVPEDMPIPEAMKEKVTELAKIFNSKELSASEKTQKAIDLHVETQKQALEQFKEVKNGWKKQVMDDPALKSSIGAANDIVRKFAGDEKQLAEFQGALKFLGLGNHPAFVRFCANVAKATGEDSMDGKDGGSGGSKKSLAELMYPNMPQS